MTKQMMLDLVVGTPARPVDARTGLSEAGTFIGALDRELTRVRRTGEPFTFGIVDIDRFGRLREQRGAEGAAEVCGEVGALIHASLREIDIATLCGEDVFPVLLARTSSELGSIAGERIRRSVESRFGGATTVSIGLASFPDDALDKDVLMERAVDALVLAKAAGGNRVHAGDRRRRSGAGPEERVLIVDDDKQNVKLVSAQLAPLGYQLLTATSAAEALEIVGSQEVDLVLLDVMMPGMNGFEVCRRIKNAEATRQVPVILLTALEDSESRVRGIEAGADDFITKPAHREELLARTRSLVRVKKLNRSLVSLENALISLANAVEAKDNYTLGHTQRVATMAVALGARLGLDSRELQGLRLGGILHDVGKIGVPEEVLNKKGALDEEEWKVMKNHVELGYRICLPLMESIGSALDMIRHHHEKLDGSSYPDGLRGDAVSLEARIMGVVDCYDALVTDRPYRPALPREKALAILEEEVARGKLDGRVVETLRGLVGGHDTASR
jgi:putative two-component system response regulator